MPRRLNVSPVNNKFIQKIFTFHFPRTFDYVALINYLRQRIAYAQ